MFGRDTRTYPLPNKAFLSCGLKISTQKKPPRGGFLNLEIKNFEANSCRSRTMFAAQQLP